MFVVFDLDGTLADTTHREHYVRRPVGEKDWTSLHEAARHDPPKHGILRTYLALEATGAEIQIWTGRDEVYREQATNWLAKNCIDAPTLKMRPCGDRTPDDELKSQWLDELSSPVNLAFEDRQRVVDMWRRRGVTCCQVAPGDF